MTKKFGWCLGPLPHKNCRRKFRHWITGKTYECDCPCHTSNDKALKELI